MTTNQSQTDGSLDQFYGEIQRMLQPMFTEFQSAQIQLIGESIGNLEALAQQSPAASPVALMRTVLRHCDETTLRVTGNIEAKVVDSLRRHLRLESAALEVVGRFVGIHCSQLARETESALLGVVISRAGEISGAQARWSQARH
jgi:hypothetical protein